MASLPLDEQAKLAIDEQLAPRRTRWAELEESFGRAPAEIPDEHVAQKVTTLIAQMGALIRAIELSHQTAKQPWLDAGRTIDGIKNALADQVETAKRTLEQRLTAYQTAKADRIEAERAALRAQDEERGDPEPGWQDPRLQDRQHVTIRSDQGASAHLADVYDIEIVDPKKVPKRYLQRPKVIAAIIAEVRADVTKGDTIAGVKATKQKKSRVRRG